MPDTGVRPGDDTDQILVVISIVHYILRLTIETMPGILLLMQVLLNDRHEKSLTRMTDNRQLLIMMIPLLIEEEY